MQCWRRQRCVAFTVWNPRQFSWWRSQDEVTALAGAGESGHQEAHLEPSLHQRPPQQGLPLQAPSPTVSSKLIARAARTEVRHTATWGKMSHPCRSDELFVKDRAGDPDPQTQLEDFRSLSPHLLLCNRKLRRKLSRHKLSLRRGKPHSQEGRYKQGHQRDIKSPVPVTAEALNKASSSQS